MLCPSGVATRIGESRRNRHEAFGGPVETSPPARAGNRPNVIDYADEIGNADVVFDDRGVRVVVDRESLPMLDGVEVDFVRQGLNESFKLRNPNVTDECGCGESVKFQS